MDRAKPCCGRIDKENPNYAALKDVYLEQLPEHTAVSFKKGGPRPVLLDGFITHTSQEALFFVSAV